MPELLALLSGVIVTIMNGVNAGLLSLFGDLSSTQQRENPLTASQPLNRRFHSHP